MNIKRRMEDNEIKRDDDYRNKTEQKAVEFQEENDKRSELK